MQNLKNSILSKRNFNDLNTLNQVCDQGDAEALSLLGIVWTEIAEMGFLGSCTDSESISEIKKKLKKQLETSLQILFGKIKIQKNSNLKLQKICLKSCLEILQVVENPLKLQMIFQEILMNQNWKFLDHAALTLTPILKVRFYKFLKETLNQLILADSREIEGVRKKRKILENLTADKKLILENSFYLLQKEKEPKELLFKEKYGEKAYSDAWLAFLSHSMDNKTLKKVLIELDSVIPNLQDPRLLADFYVDSYNLGGVFGILALNGIFTLITKYDLEYPKFYEKLYQLLDPSVLHSKFKSRFFNLVSIFLGSSLLPVNLVAGFIKKFARLACFAPPSGITIILPIIYNLLRSHHKCIVMIHKPKNMSNAAPSIETFETFDFFESDPVKSGALDSSLWELSTLDRHYNFQIKEQISKFSAPLLSNQKVSEFLYETYDTFAAKRISDSKDIRVEINLKDSIF